MYLHEASGLSLHLAQIRGIFCKRYMQSSLDLNSISKLLQSGTVLNIFQFLDCVNRCLAARESHRRRPWIDKSMALSAKPTNLYKTPCNLSIICNRYHRNLTGMWKSSYVLTLYLLRWLRRTQLDDRIMVSVSWYSTGPCVGFIAAKYLRENLNILQNFWRNSLSHPLAVFIGYRTKHHMQFATYTFCTNTSFYCSTTK